jgi:hypothetical protein
VVARVAAHPGERAACAKSHNLATGLTRDSAKLRSVSRWLRASEMSHFRTYAPQHSGSYSITSSARVSSADGNSRPIALAVRRLITSSYLEGA